MTQFYNYTARLKTRKQIDVEIPRHLQGWWADVCPGKVLENLRDATAADLARCNLNELASRDPADYLCEDIERGALISREAILWLRIKVPTAFTGAHKLAEMLASDA